MNIWEAAENGNIERINTLLEKGTNIDSKEVEKGWTSLMTAVTFSNTTSSLKTVKFLLEKGANPNLQNKKGWTPLASSARNSNTSSSLETVRLLLEYKADPNIVDGDKYTALIRASMNTSGDSSLETVKLLLEKGANINYITDTGVSALVVACRFSNSTSSLETVRFLLENGADPNLSKGNNFPLLISALNTNNGSSLETVILLLENGADINKKAEDGYTSLMAASTVTSTTSSLETVRLLLEQGADPNLKINKGSSTLMLAVNNINKGGSLETIKLLLEYRADPFEQILCPTDECTKLINSTRWERLSLRDKQTAAKYNQQIPISKDVWLLIMRYKRQKQLCSNLSSEQNKEVLKYFALELEIPLEQTQNMTKGQLCGIISRQIIYKDYDKIISEKRGDKMKLLEVANKYGIDITKPLDQIMTDLAKIF
jgi:ankyrin repeat protein